ncbi:hypothetical protein CVD28_11225 [Bacillus sp. M6-12]|uniref:PucR family transcriptional regulator n=1 Tax=Bacillus sp. M6-12 TaxID=2054166 RepID=UPI000C780CE2|nr:helix-turn-helix domain-containing protein [Bacillus sp. M6-12]PLS17564.1 hypothetical protein CVD28_11225 [Bacillus sp. M6-12]
MLEKLINKYSGAITEKSAMVPETAYLWIQDETGQLLGIPENLLTAEEVRLLLTLFSVPNEKGLNKSKPQQNWHSYLTGNLLELPLTSWDNVRFIHFQVSNSDFSRTDFEEAFTSLVSEDSILVWTGSMQGVFIEHIAIDSLKTSELFPLLDTLESDFYVRLHLLAGASRHIESGLKQNFDYENEIFSATAGKLTSAKILDLPRAFPYMLAIGISDDFKSWFITSLIGCAMEDEELISTVKTYIECGSNASLASKKLYIHRNSLQYRIDKFIERTGLDIRSFDEALTAYLLILLSSAVYG